VSPHLNARERRVLKGKKKKETAKNSEFGGGGRRKICFFFGSGEEGGEEIRPDLLQAREKSKLHMGT